MSPASFLPVEALLSGPLADVTVNDVCIAGLDVLLGEGRTFAMCPDGPTRDAVAALLVMALEARDEIEGVPTAVAPRGDDELVAMPLQVEEPAAASGRRSGRSFCAGSPAPGRPE